MQFKVPVQDMRVLIDTIDTGSIKHGAAAFDAVYLMSFVLSTVPKDRDRPVR